MSGQAFGLSFYTKIRDEFWAPCVIQMGMSAGFLSHYIAHDGIDSKFIEPVQKEVKKPILGSILECKYNELTREIRFFVDGTISGEPIRLPHDISYFQGFVSLAKSPTAKFEFLES